MTLIRVASDVPRLTLRCLACRWLFTVSSLVDTPRCVNCGNEDQFHHVHEQDFCDPDRYAAFGPGIPGAKPPNATLPPVGDRRYAHLFDRNCR